MAVSSDCFEDRSITVNINDGRIRSILPKILLCWCISIKTGNHEWGGTASVDAVYIYASRKKKLHVCHVALVLSDRMNRRVAVGVADGGIRLRHLGSSA